MVARLFVAVTTALLLGALLLATAPSRHAQAAEMKTAIFAGGCFWCVEDAFDQVDGVSETVSGYAGGTKPNPTYGSHEGYVEALRVRYDPDKVSYATLLDRYWRNIDPFNAEGQFCDEGPAYRTVIFVGDDEERALAEKTKSDVETRFKKDVATKIEPVTTFTPAEEYHQDYHTKNPIAYKYYKWNCGRAQRLAEIWGEPNS